MMSPGRTGRGKGHFRFDRTFADVGRIVRSSGTSVLREFHRRDAVLTKLHETAQLEALRAFRDGVVSIEELIEQDRRGRGGEALDVLVTRRSLVQAIADALPVMGRAASSRDRYRQSLAKLVRLADLADAPVATLKSVPWETLAAAWPGSPADWNRMRAAVSRFLTVLTGDKFSPVRRAVVALIPRATEPEGEMPELTPEAFLRAVERIPDAAVRAGVLFLVLTGARIGEYLSLDRSALHPDSHRVRIRQGKTGGGWVAVAPEFWPWVEAAVPFGGLPIEAVRSGSSTRYARMRAAWTTAIAAEGLAPITLHGLRHCAAQWASNEGASTGAIRQLLRHKSVGMTQRYENQATARTASHAVGRAITRAQGER